MLFLYAKWNAIEKIHFIKFIVKMLVLTIYTYILYNSSFWFWQNIWSSLIIKIKNKNIKINSYIFKKSNLFYLIISNWKK